MGQHTSSATVPTLTLHARQRMQQRCIPEHAITLCLDHGRRFWLRDGLMAYFLGRREWLKQRRRDPKLAQDIQPYQGLTVIFHPSHRCVITLYRALRPLRHHRGCQR